MKENFMNEDELIDNENELRNIEYPPEVFDYNSNNTNTLEDNSDNEDIMNLQKPHLKKQPYKT